VRLAAALVFVAAMTAGTACGATSTVSPNEAVKPMLLSAAAVPGLPYTTASLSAGELSKDASIPGMSAMLASWGYVTGEQRTFQGESRHLTLVVSRALEFEDVLGAASYVSFVHSNATAYFGIGGVQPLDAQGRAGWQFSPQACACHMANPVVVGVVSSGSSVTWLEINGPDATPSLLLSLLDPTNSAPAS
jgi:hypothetical protein